MPNQSSLELVRGGTVQPLAVGSDAIFSMNLDVTTQTIEAPLVFVGYGLKIPEQNYDDFAGLNLKGKIVVYFSGSAADVPAAGHEIVHEARRIDPRWLACRCVRTRYAEARGSPDKPGGHATLQPSHRRHRNARQTPKTYSVPLVEGTN